ncbi:MAG: acyl-CoA dehydrogenase family protein, partial [Chloroflexi bacterium]|nr:acyl-CoA dehydrogenase family protein [Chloroflexota bacterium]
MIDLPAEQRELVDRVTAFVDSEVVPVAQARDTRDEYPVDLVGRLRELGLFGLVAPVQYGGAGVEPPAYALVMEELGRGWVSLVPIANAHSSVVTILSRYGTEAQRGHWLPRLARGELMGALGLTEASGGSDLAAITTTANKQGDGYHVRGAKRLITHARGAGLLLVLAKTDPAAEPSTRALALFLLEQEGVEWRVTRDLPKLGARSVETSELTIEASVPADRLVGEQVGAGFRQLMDGLEVGRIAVAAAAIGLARAALWDAVAYARERRAFGRPIAELQGLRFKLADLATQIAAARALVLAAARAK